MLMDCESNNVICPLIPNKNACHRLVTEFGAKDIADAVGILGAEAGEIPIKAFVVNKGLCAG
jgi:hypothetical protein